MEFQHCTCYIFTLLALCFLYVEGLRFNLASNQKKCLREEVHKNVLVTGEYEVQDNGQRVDLLVTDLRGHTLYSKENAIKGRFAFTTDEYDQYEICFTSKAKGGIAAEREVFLNIKHGVEAKNYEDIAKAEKLKPLEVELRRLEDWSSSLVEDFAYMRDRETEMRSTNESTHSLVLYFSIFSMVCLLGLATWQVLYLRRYFKSKKLIE